MKQGSPVVPQRLCGCWSRRSFAVQLLVSGLLVSLGLSGQAQTGVERLVVKRGCRFSTDGWSGTDEQVIRAARVQMDDRRHRSGIPQVVVSITRELRIKYVFDLYISQGQSDAMAVPNDDRGVIILDAEFLKDLNRRTGTDWSAIHVIAHEIGHHIAGFSDDLHRNELYADYWSGLILGRLRAPRDEAWRAFGSGILGGEATRTHPSGIERIKMVRLGWKHARQGTIDFSFCNGCRP